jgi:hypothetical protein
LIPHLLPLPPLRPSHGGGHYAGHVRRRSRIHGHSSSRSCSCSHKLLAIAAVAARVATVTSGTSCGGLWSGIGNGGGAVCNWVGRKSLDLDGVGCGLACVHGSNATCLTHAAMQQALQTQIVPKGRARGIFLANQPQIQDTPAQRHPCKLETNTKFPRQTRRGPVLSAQNQTASAQYDCNAPNARASSDRATPTRRFFPTPQIVVPGHSAERFGTGSSHPRASALLAYMSLWSKGIDAVGGQPGRSTNRNQKQNEGLSRAQSHYASLAAYSCVKSAPRIATPTRRAPDVRLRERA